MDARTQKHRIISWLARLLVVLTLVVSCGAQAAVDSVPAQWSWCTWTPPFTYGRWITNSNFFVPNNVPNLCFSSLDAAAKASAVTTIYTNLWEVIVFTYTGCVEDAVTGSGTCTENGSLAACQGWPNIDCNSLGTVYSLGPFVFTKNATYACPVPTVNPAVPYKYNAGTHMCERSSLIITLSGGSEVEPSNNLTSIVKTLPLIATVIDQNTKQPPANPIKVKVSLKVDPTSGGHDHGTSDRPRGGIAELDTCPSDDTCWTSPNPTDSNGTVVFNFNAPEASGTHTITATCDGCSNTATKPVDVKVSDLWPIPGSAYYALTEDGSTKVIGSTTKHTSNHYLTSAASMKVWKLAANYYNYQVLKGVKSPTLLHLNDASLKWGGVFDLDADWDEPHAEHRRGTVVDVRANSSPGAIPDADFPDFIEMSANMGIDPHFEGGSTNQHYHLRLLNRPE